METLNVLIKLNELICHKEFDTGDAEPYLWTIFFKIDGNTVKQNDVMLSGQAQFHFGFGSHGNLLNTDVSNGEIVPIPYNVGEWSTTLTPIIIDFFGQTFEIPGVVGVLVVLMEEDNVSDSGAEAGHIALNNKVRDEINQFISNLSLIELAGNNDPIDALNDKVQELIANIKKDISGIVKTAIKSNQSFLENFWSFWDRDDKIGDIVWNFNANEIKANNNTIVLNERDAFTTFWKPQSPFGVPQQEILANDWEINGEISASEICPANAVNSESEKVLKQALDLNKLRKFRAKIFKEFPQSSEWWKLALKNSPYLIWELKQDKSSLSELVNLIKVIEKKIEEKDSKLPDSFFEKMEQLTDKFSTSKFKRLRIDSFKVKPIVSDLRGKTMNDIGNYLSKNKPSSVRKSSLLKSDKGNKGYIA